MVIRSFNTQIGTSSTTELSYSEFLHQIDRGEIQTAQIQGDVIQGVNSLGGNFYTVAPVNTNISQVLLEKNVQINVMEEEETPFIISFLINWGPILFLIGFWIFMLRKAPGAGGGASKLFSINKSKAKRINPEDNNISFDDIAGIDEAKQDLFEIIEFLRNPEPFKKIGGKIPKGVMMVGPPGNGKTMLAKAVAAEASVPFFSISGSDFVEMFVGVGASRVRSLFEEAKATSNAIIFIDEIDAVGRHRGAGLGGGHDEREQTINQLLVELDGFEKNSGVIVIAATNRADILDPALLRPGRFDRHIHINLPDMKGRENILKIHAKKIRMDDGTTDLSVIARGTPGFSGAELANLLNEAALYAARRDCKSVAQEHLEWAKDKVVMGMERRSMVITEEDKKVIAYHEAGHALVSAYLEHCDPLHKVTIIPRGQSLGLTTFLPEDDRVSHSLKELNARLTLSMGGRAAEQVIFEDVTTGAEGDLKMATQIAYRMMSRWGMSKKLGAVVVEHDHSGKFLPMDFHNNKIVSEQLLEEVDEEVKTTLQTSYSTALNIVKNNLDKLHSLAQALMEKETLDRNEFLSIIGKVEFIPNT